MFGTSQKVPTTVSRNLKLLEASSSSSSSSSVLLYLVRFIRIVLSFLFSYLRQLVSAAGIVCFVSFAFCIVKSRQDIATMRGVAALSPVKKRFKQILPIKGSWGIESTYTVSKQRDYAETGVVTKEKTDPIAAFSRPPPPPPVIGPLLALSLLEALWNRNSEDD